MVWGLRVIIDGIFRRKRVPEEGSESWVRLFFTDEDHKNTRQLKNSRQIALTNTMAKILGPFLYGRLAGMAKEKGCQGVKAKCFQMG